MGILWRLCRPSVFLFRPETAHKLSIFLLRSGILPTAPIGDKRLHCTVAGLNFANPLGLAAGFDKNGEVVRQAFALGFGFTEIGTVTPLPQKGNEKPRLFRLVAEEAIINRMGFNNKGQDHVSRNVAKVGHRQGPVGINIGANKESSDRIADYISGLRHFYALADFFTVNISSPNTPGLRDLQGKDQLAELLARLEQERHLLYQQSGKRAVIFLKIAPDLHENQLIDMAAQIKQSSLDGIIISNTTLQRQSLSREAAPAGGLSGKPLFTLSTAVLAKMRVLLGNHLPIIGVGGVSDADTFIEKVRAGADLIQLYSALVYGGPFLAREIIRATQSRMRREGINHIYDYRGTATNDWANKPLY